MTKTTSYQALIAALNHAHQLTHRDSVVRLRAARDPGARPRDREERSKPPRLDRTDGNHEPVHGNRRRWTAGA